MGAVDIVKQSIKYPFENKKVWLIIGVLFLLGVILEELTEFFEGNLLYHAFKIIYFIGSLFVSGYEVSVVHHDGNTLWGCGGRSAPAEAAQPGLRPRS